MSQFWALDLEVFEGGESPVWDDRQQVFYWVDHRARQVHSWDVRVNLRRHWPWAEVPACCGLDTAGDLIVADKTGLWRLGNIHTPPVRIVDFRLPDHHRPNDGKPGPDGAFWMTVMDENPERAPTGYLMRVTSSGTTTHVTGLRTGNGLDWSPDGKRMYLSDSRGGWIDRWRFNTRTGALSDRRRFFTCTAHSGRPDGATVDAEGCYWFAGLDAGRLNRVSPSGRLLYSLALPFKLPSMPCFGGADLSTLFLTSLKNDDSSQAAGHIYHTEFSVRGLPARRFSLGA